MASPPKDSGKVFEGIFAVNKPQWSSSAGVIRDLQTHFANSSLFAPWLESTRRSMTLSQSKPRHIANLKVKLGHGGTLDPMATGVLIIGVGRGTKCLQRFLECTKTYECVVLFGAATDSYDAVGKVVGKAEYAHVTRELVEEKLGQFRGKIMQKPSVFSALKVNGKKMYEYAREGGEIPEVAARPVEVLDMELVEWLEPGSHAFKWPEEEVDGEERQGAEKLLGIRKKDKEVHDHTAARRGRKRSRSLEDDHVEGAGEQPKRPRTESEPAMSGALPVDNAPVDVKTANGRTTNGESAANAPFEEAIITDNAPALQESSTEATRSPVNGTSKTSSASPPAARLRMTVTSGFYVRSLCHDLGLACSSLGVMSSLIRQRQGDYSLPTASATSPSILTDPETSNASSQVLEWTDIQAGPSTWEPILQRQLEDFMEKEGWEADEVEDDETWEARKSEIKEERRGGDRDRSYRGGGYGKGKWKGKGGGGVRYSKGMNGGGRRD